MRRAVILFNLGGPDAPDAVQPFLFNLFNDPAIIGAPWPVRPLLARSIARRRAPVARAIYAHLDGRSPLLENTQKQAVALTHELASDGETGVFIAMRYWHPRAAQTVEEVKSFAPREIVLLPLYPHFSTTTTRSSVKEWHSAARRAGLEAPTRIACCYPVLPGFIDAIAQLLRQALPRVGKKTSPRILFSAHGLPKRVVARGDPYAWQVEQSAAKVAEQCGLAPQRWTVCYQSRVGPLEWIGPSIESEILRAGADGVPVIVVPIAFVSEHAETLVELDKKYRDLAASVGVPSYTRVVTVSTHRAFIRGLAKLVRALAETPAGWCRDGSTLCPAAHGACPWANKSP